MAAPSNPFTLVFDALWELVELGDVSTLIKVGNRVKYNDPYDRDPLKTQEIQAADVPELILVTDGFTGNLFNTTHTTKCTRNYTFLISTGDMRLTEHLLQVEWAIFRALLSWKQVLGELEWAGKRFVKRANMVSVTEGSSDPTLNRGIRGWSAIWRNEVEMHFVTSDLQLPESSSSA